MIEIIKHSLSILYLRMFVVRIIFYVYERERERDVSAVNYFVGDGIKEIVKVHSGY